MVWATMAKLPPAAAVLASLKPVRALPGPNVAASVTEAPGMILLLPAAGLVVKTIWLVSVAPPVKVCRLPVCPAWKFTIAPALRLKAPKVRSEVARRLPRSR